MPERMIRDERGRFVGVDEYAGCPTYERHGDCRCSTGVPGWGCDRPSKTKEDTRG